ncbi:MAG: hypothetical protein WCT44_01925, partial [Candidatus Paceibacterota bacterium]
KRESNLLLRTALGTIKEEILNGFHEDQSGEIRMLREMGFDLYSTSTISRRINVSYLKYYQNLYADLKQTAENNNNSTIKKVIERAEKVFFQKVQNGLVSYGNALQIVRSSKKAKKNEDILYFLGMLLPLHQYYRLGGIVRRLTKMEIME